MQYDIPIGSGWKVIAKVKVFVYATNADANADARAMTEAPWLAKNVIHDNTLDLAMH